MHVEKLHAREPRDLAGIRGLSRRRIGPGSQKRNPDKHAGEESNTGIVPAKLPNKAGETRRRRWWREGP